MTEHVIDRRCLPKYLAVTVVLGALTVLPLVGGCPPIPPTTGCTVDADCNDGDECTSDTCGEGGVCINEPIPSCPAGPAIDVSNLPDDVVGALDIDSEITNVTIASPPVLEFTVTTANGTPVTGIGSLWEEDERYVRYTLTKLVPSFEGEPSTRIAYTRDTTNDGSTPPDYDTGSSLVDHGDGTYTFTFNTDVANVTGVTYEPSLSHRAAGQIGARSSPLEAQNLVMDFVPDGGDVVDTRNIASIASCNECHGQLVEHGRRFVTEYCANCHTPELAAGEGDFSFMIHKLHAAQMFDILDEGVDYSEVTYPQELMNCSKCHNAADEATVDGDNWKNVPSIMACGGCHSDVNFETGENHVGGPQSNNSLCSTCHPSASIEEYHLTNNETAENPDVPDGLYNFEYQIADASVDGDNELQIDVSILRDGEPLDLLNLPDDLTRSPSFLFGYADGPQDGIENPIDFNNLGRTAGQPESANLVDLIDGGSVATSGTPGIFTVTVPDAFPVEASMRTVALQSRFRQMVGEEEIDRRTLSVVQTVEGDDARRVIIDPAKCGNCHEWLQLHGGSRVVSAASDPMQPVVCVLCHNPNLSSSGRTADPDEELREDTVAALGEDPLMYPERTQNFRDLIHGIHAADYRSGDYEFVRNRLNGIYYNWDEVTFPGILNDCLTCHVEGTYELPLSDDALVTTEWTTTGDPAEDRDTVLAARDTAPNGTDLVNTPSAASCFMCHNSAAAVAHMEQNGGQINVLLRENDEVGADFVGVGADDLTRDEVVGSGMAESCTICHGSGRTADVNVVHGIE